MLVSRRVFQREQKTVLLYALSEEVLAFFILILGTNDVSHCVTFICTFAIRV